jgi:hypothetical protein
MQMVEIKFHKWQNTNYTLTLHVDFPSTLLIHLVVKNLPNELTAAKDQYQPLHLMMK